MSEKRKLIQNARITVEDMVLEASYQPTLIDRIRFKTKEIGYLTWKTKKNEYMEITIDGLKINKTKERGYELSELPGIIYRIRDILKEKGEVLILSDYTELTGYQNQKFYMLDDHQVEEIRILGEKSNTACPKCGVELTFGFDHEFLDKLIKEQ